jgi:hypothetical protein
LQDDTEEDDDSDTLLLPLLHVEEEESEVCVGKAQLEYCLIVCNSLTPNTFNTIYKQYIYSNCKIIN